MPRSKFSAYRAFRAESYVAPALESRLESGPEIRAQRLSFRAYQIFKAAAKETPVSPSRRVAAQKPAAAICGAPLPPLEPYKRCTCGACGECHENAKWDRIFAKFEVKKAEIRGIYQCALNDL